MSDDGEPTGGVNTPAVSTEGTLNTPGDQSQSVSAERHKETLDKKALQHSRAMSRATTEASGAEKARLYESLGVSTDEEFGALSDKFKATNTEADKNASLQRKLAKAESALEKQKADFRVQKEENNNALIRDTITRLAINKCMDVPVLHDLVKGSLGVDPAGKVFVKDEHGDTDYERTAVHVIEAMLKEKPYLAKGPTSGGSGGHSAGGNSPPATNGEGKPLTGFMNIMTADPKDQRLSKQFRQEGPRQAIRDGKGFG